VEQFLNHTKTCLPNDVYLRVSYNMLKKATDNFTKNETRINCSKIINLVLHHIEEEIPKELEDYFPHAKTSTAYFLYELFE
jgi:hypothetical protein